MLIRPVHAGEPPRLDDTEAAPPEGLPGKKDMKQRMRELTRRMDRLQRCLYAERKQSLLVVLQARDAGGKDGTIRRVFGGLNPQGCHVTSFGAPSTLELQHDFLWRIHQSVPRAGLIGVFNRSHYEDVLVVRVRELVPRAVWSARYDQIVAFESILHQNGVTILKLMLHISGEEQRRRLLRRLEDPERNWKFDPGDLEDRARWEEYRDAYIDAMARTSTDDAPWFIIPADDKRARDLLVAELVVDSLERMNPQWPTASESVLRFVSALQ